MNREDWNDRYRTSDLVWTAQPNQFVVAEIAGLPAGRALDLAAGEGPQRGVARGTGMAGDRGRLLGRGDHQGRATSPRREERDHRDRRGRRHRAVARAADVRPGRRRVPAAAGTRPLARARQCRGRGRAGRHARGRRARRHQPRARLRRTTGPRRAHRPRAGRRRSSTASRSRRPNGSNGRSRRPTARASPSTTSSGPADRSTGLSTSPGTIPRGVSLPMTRRNEWTSARTSWESCNAGSAVSKVRCAGSRTCSPRNASAATSSPRSRPRRRRSSRWVSACSPPASRSCLQDPEQSAAEGYPVAEVERLFLKLA